MEKEKLPIDIIHEILFFLPPKSLLRFRTVCKLWDSLISSPAFVKKHLSMGKHHNLVLKSPDSVCFVNCNDHSEQLMETNQLDFLANDQTLNDVLFTSCNGLLCLMFKNGSFVLWNPSIRQYKRVPLSEKVGVDVNYSFAFGYDRASDDYNIVRVLHGKRTAGYVGTPFEIYSLRRNSWQKMCDIPWNIMFLGRYASNTTCTFVDGKYYWIIHFAEKYKATDTGVMFTWGVGFSEEIMCFDFMEREISKMKLPPNVSNTDDARFELGVVRGCLCVFHYHDHLVDIWTPVPSEVRTPMLGEEQETAWTKLIIIPELIPLLNIARYPRPICSMDNGKILLRVLMETGNKFYLFDPEENPPVREFDDRERSFDKVILYTESLVSPHAIGGDGRQCSLAHERRGECHQRIRENDLKDPYASRAMDRIFYVTEDLL